MANSTGQLNKNGRGKDKNERTMHPNSLKNLNGGHWKKGESGNPQGHSLKEILTEELLKVPTLETDGFDGKGRTNARLMIRREVIDARTGDRYARSEIWERYEGKVTQPIKPVGENGAIATFFLVMSDGSKRTAKELRDKTRDS